MPHGASATSWSDPAQRATRLPVDEASTLPGAVYHDRAFFDLERTNVWQSSWVAAAELADVAEPGDMLPVTVGGAPVVLVNDRGTVRAFHNVCRHRGAKVVQEKCSRKGSVLCPYHRWGYSLDGRLLATPSFDGAEGDALPDKLKEQFSTGHVKNFDPAEHGLLPARVDFALGLAFVNLNGEAPPLKEWLGDLLPALDDYEAQLGRGGPGLRAFARKTYDVAANWKLLMENYLEYYHLPAVHPELCGVSGVDEHSRNQGKGMYMCFKTDPLTKGGTPIDPGLIPPYPTLREHNREAAYHVALFPNTFFSLYPDALFRVVLAPVDAGRTIETATFLSHDGAFAADGGEKVLQEMFEFWDLINTQDIEIVENVQQGTAAPAYRGGRFSFRFEEPVHRFQNMVVDKILAHEKTRYRVPAGDA